MTAVKTPIHVHNEFRNGVSARTKQSPASDVQTEDLGTQMINGFAATEREPPGPSQPGRSGISKPFRLFVKPGYPST